MIKIEFSTKVKDFLSSLISWEISFLEDEPQENEGLILEMKQLELDFEKGFVTNEQLLILMDYVSLELQHVDDENQEEIEFLENIYSSLEELKQ